MSRSLSVFLHDSYVGDLIEKDGNNQRFIYKQGVTKPISIALPLSLEKHPNSKVKPFFENLLPEGELRNLIGETHRVSSNNSFSLLEVIGEDCAGAIHLSNSKDLPDAKPLVALNNDTFLELLKTNLQYNVSYEIGMRLSLAGVQNKTSVFIKDNKMFYPTHYIPSTHIIKYENRRFKDILANEYFCTKLAEKLGLPVSKLQLESMDTYHYLLIERYDRKIEDGKVSRIHSEDFCQILSVMSTNKYQLEGGPSLKDLISTLRTYSSSLTLDLILMAKILVYNYLIGNADYHGKNLSLLHLGVSKYKLTPFYDLVSTVVYPELSLKSAMSINKKYNVDHLEASDFIEEFNTWQIDGKKMFEAILKDYKVMLSHANVIKADGVLIKHQDMVSNIIRVIETNYKKLTAFNDI